MANQKSMNLEKEKGKPEKTQIQEKPMQKLEKKEQTHIAKIPKVRKEIKARPLQIHLLRPPN